MVQALNEMHKRRVVHRDIKPENILLTSTSAEGEYKIADFGASRVLQENAKFVIETLKSFNSTVAGTGCFMSPEIKDEKPNGVKSDSWSLGITMGYLFGLDKVYPDKYPKGLPQFFIHCYQGKHDLYLASQ